MILKVKVRRTGIYKNILRIAKQFACTMASTCQQFFIQIAFQLPTPRPLQYDIDCPATTLANLPLQWAPICFQSALASPDHAQRLHFFFLLPASSISWKKPPRLRSTLAITEYKLCTANKTTLFSTMQNMIMVLQTKCCLHVSSVTTVHCLAGSSKAIWLRSISSAFFSLALFFFSLFFSFFFACQSSISCWVQPFVIHGSSLGHSWAFQLPQVSSSMGSAVLQPTVSMEFIAIRCKTP